MTTVVFAATPSAGPKRQTKHVLLLYEREMSPPTVSRLESNIRQSLTEQYPFPVRFYSEQMNAAVLTNKKAIGDQMAWYERKYREADLDLIVVVGVEDYFLPANFLSGVPVVYCNWRFDEGQVARPNTVEVNVWLGDEFEKTLALALKLHPEVHEVVVIGGTATLDKLLLAEAAEELKPFEPRIKISYWTDLTVGEITRRAATLPKGSIVLFTLLQSDADGKQMMARDFVAALSARSSAPVYAVLDTLVGYGAVGGYVTSYEHEGQIVGITAARILVGERADFIRPDVRQATQYMFDARQLARWNIARERLPAGATVLFEQPSLWPRYKWQIVAVLALAGLQSIVIAVLVVQITRRRRAERALGESEARFRSMYEHAAVGIEQVAPDGRLLMANPALCRMLGYSKRELLSKTVAEISHPDDRGGELLLLKSLVAGERDSYSLEKRYFHCNGSTVWVHVTTSAVRDAENHLLYRISIIEDITERKQAEDAVRALSGRLINAQEEERTRIAREIHDDFSQRLALLKIQLQQVVQQLGEDHAAQRKRLASISEQVATLASDLRRLSHELHSATLEHIGLAAALKDLCGEISQAHRIRVRLVDRGVPPDLPADVSLCIFRVVQQALANVVKHSGAATAEVEVAAGPEQLSLRVVDTGRGFGPTPPAGGLGLISMQERVHLVGGTFRIESQPGRGAELTVLVPLRRAAEQADWKVSAAAPGGEP